MKKLPRAALVENLDVRGLDTSGNKQRLRQRLSQYLDEAREGDKEGRLRAEAARREQVALEESGSVYRCLAARECRASGPLTAWTCVWVYRAGGG